MTTARYPRTLSAVADSDSVVVYVGGDPSVPAMATKAALLDDITVADDLTVTDDLTVGGDVVISTSLEVGSTDTERASLTGVFVSTMSVTVPSITDPDIAKVDVDVSALNASVVVTDFVLVQPTAALPTNCRYQGARVLSTDTIQVVYGSEGGNVTGAASNHRILIIKVA